MRASPKSNKELEGAWSVTSAERNKNELPAERLKDLQATFRDGRFAFRQGDKTLTEGTLRVDPEKVPRTIDLTTIDANGNDETALAIYDLTEDSLKICGAQPGETRPSEFAAMDGSGHTLTTFQRVK
jgi:uncharacterized protein (TIGR03067 family)